MAKQKEIKFRDCGYVLEGRRGNLTFAIYNDNTKKVLEEQTYYVVIRHKKIERLGFNTAGHRHFTLDAAKEFCQKITAGEIDTEALLMEFATEDMAKEQAAMPVITAKAKKFHARLDAKGHNILLAYGRGEGWPKAVGQTRTEQKPETVENSHWAIYPLPEDCRSLFVFASAEQFDKCVKNGVIPLHDDRKSPGEVRIPCFIGYAATQDLKCLDKLAGVSGSKQEQGKQPDHSETVGT